MRMFGARPVLHPWYEIFFGTFHSSLQFGQAEFNSYFLGLMMRNLLVVLLLLFPTLAIAQQPNAGPTKISGCLMSMNGAFILTTATGDRYTLKGDHDTLFSYNGKQVQVTGTPKPSQKAEAKREFQVAAVKKIADVCQ